ncbi:cell division protein ZapA [Rhodoferax sp.]|uniref:cell division protein ZapA n=1 Tax=Rhodoferax sp. TaxID=50421 RepID=UPI00374C98E7
MKQLEVQILGQSYLLGCPDGGEVRLLDAVKMVDTAMCAIRDGGKIKARDRIAVLAALNLAFDLSDRDRPASRPAPLSPPPSTPRAEAAPGDDPALSSLLEQLDLALGDDGRLI